MDYHKLKRRELQALCKKHGIPANLKNVEMADRLSSLLKEENPTKRGRSCLKNAIVLSDGDEEETVESKEPKRVKFSPQNETFVFEKTDPREMRLLARKRRDLQKPGIKENPVVVIDDDNVEENVVRVLRRRSIVVKPDAGSGVGVVDGRGKLGRNLRSRWKDTSVDEMVLFPCVEKKAKRGRKGQAVKEFVEENCREIEPEIKKGRKGRKTTKTINEKEVNRGEEVGVEDLIEGNGGDGKISVSREIVLSKVDASLSEQELDDGKVHEMAAQFVNQSVAKGCSQDKETTPGVSAPAKSLSESSEHKPHEQRHAAGDTICVEESDVKEKALANVVAAAQTPAGSESSMLQNSNNGEVESFVQANKVEESYLNLSFVADKNSHEETASSSVTPSRNLKRQFSGGGVGGGQPVCHSDMKPGMPGSSEISDTHWEQLSSPTGESIGGMTESKTYESIEGQEFCNQSRNEQFIEQENKCEESPYLSNSSENKNVVEDECPVICKESDVQPTEQETMPNFFVDQQSSHFISEKKVVLGQEASIKAKVQSSIVVEGLALSSNASAATLSKTIEEGQDTKVVSGVDSTSIDSEDCPLNQSLNNDDSEVRTEPSSTISTSSLYLQSQIAGDIRVLLGSTKKGEESCKETSRDDIAYLASNCKENNLAEEDKLVIVENLDEVNVKLEADQAVKDDMTNSPESKELKSEKVARGTKQDAFAASNGGGTPVSVQERKWSKVIHDGNICPSVSGIGNKASECILVSDKTKRLKLSSLEADEDTSTDNSFFRNSGAIPLNVEDRELSEVSHSDNVLACRDLGSNKVSEHNPAVNTIVAVDKLGFREKDDDKGADCPCKDILLRLENLCDNYFAQSSEPPSCTKLHPLSGSMAEESHKVTPSRDLTCFAKDSNVAIIVKQPDEVYCFDEPKLQHLVSRDDIDNMTNDAQRKELEFEREDWTSEEDLLASGGKVEKSVSFQKRNSSNLTSERSTLQYDVPSSSYEIECISFVSDPCHPVKDLDHMTVKYAEETDEGVIYQGKNSVTNLQVGDCESADTSNFKHATSSGDFNEISECSPIKDTVVSVSEPEFPVRDDKTNADLKSNSCNIPVEPMENETPKVCHSQDSSPFTAQETTNIRLEINNCPAQTSRSADSVEMNVEGVSICGNDSPKYAIRKELDEAFGQAFSQQSKFLGSVQKEFDNLDEETGSVEGAIGQGANSSEKKSFTSKSEREFGEAVERGLAIQSSMLVAVSEEGKSDVGDEIVKGSMVGIEPVYCVGKGKGSGSSSRLLEMDEKSGSPMRYSGKSSLCDAALGLDNDAGSIMVACPPSISRKSTCYSSDVCAGTCEIASDSFQISQQNQHNEILQNASINDIEELNSGEHMLFKDNQYDKAYNDNIEELDPAKDPDARDALEERGYSVEKDAYIFPFTPPLTDATNSESLVAMHKVLDSTSSQSFVDTSGLYEMVLEVSNNHLFTHQEMDDGYCIENSEPNFKDAEDDSRDTTHVGRASYPPFSICENKAANASEEIVVSCAVGDFIALSNSMEEHGKLAAEQFSGDSENGVEWDGNDNDASDNKAEADSSSPKISVNLTDQPQEQNHTPLMPSYQQMDPTESACQPATNTTTLLEKEDVKSRIESCVFTDSEIDLFWGEIGKDKVRELPTEASDFTLSVNEYEVANVENDTGSTHQPAVGDNSDDAETEDVKSKIESSVFTDSEFDLFWGEIEKDKVMELPIEASDVTLSVNEFEVANVENVTGSTHQPAVGDNSGLDEQTLEKGIDREGRGESTEENGDEQKCINVKENENSLIRRNNTRSILIHGTPQKPPPFMHDMKENAAAPKRLLMVGATAVKRRKALEDISK